MKLVSWNVNGLRSAMRSGFAALLKSVSPDVICLQEVKASAADIDPALFTDFHTVWNCAVKKGYSGVLMASRTPPLHVRLGVGIRSHDGEGRLITAEFDDYFVINAYVPNSRRGLVRLDYRLRWDDALRRYLRRLDRVKPVILCGDLNVAHTEIDLAHPRANRRNAGFTDEERANFTRLLNAGFIDSFRALHPGAPGHYTWWTARTDARERNIGWRIDYWLVSQRFWPRVARSTILNTIRGSDHCPIMIELRTAPLPGRKPRSRPAAR